MVICAGWACAGKALIVKSRAATIRAKSAVGLPPLAREGIAVGGAIL
jgi:hypothetical protein